MKKLRFVKSLAEEVFQTDDRCMRAYEDLLKSYSKSLKNCRILDVGCGLGEYTSLFYHNNNQVFGLDVKKFILKRFSKKFKFVKYDGFHMPFDDNFFDVIVSFDVIEHVVQDLFFVQELKRVLKPKGRFLVSTPNRNRLGAFLLRLIGRPYVFPLVGQEFGYGGKSIHYREYISSELRDLFLKAGFKNFKIRYFWTGLRGKINFGINLTPIKSLAQYLFITNF
jgi:SAM-dependent methyltransferase